MRLFTRRSAAVTAAILLAVGVAVPPATAGAGPAVIDDHDSHIAPRAFDVFSSTGGTVYATDNGGFGRVYLAPGTMTTATSTVDLGPRPRTFTPTTISGSRIAMPVAGAQFDTPITQVRSCLIGTCPTLSTLTIPAGWVYAGNAEDRAVIYHKATNNLGLIGWTGGSVTNQWLMPADYSDDDEPPTARGDATGIAVSGGGDVTYVNRAAASGAGTVHYLGDGTGAVLTPTYVVWYIVGVVEPDFDQTHVYRVLRSTTEPNPTPALVRALTDAPIEDLVANDFGVAYTIPSDAGDGTSALWTMAYDGTPVQYARPLTTNALAPFLATNQILINDRLAGMPGFYKVTPGSYSGSLTGLVPVRGANTFSVGVSHGRAVYADDMTADLPLFTRTVTDGLPGPESLVTGATAGQVAISGPYVAYFRYNADPSKMDVVYGRLDGAMKTTTVPMSESGKVALSGRRVLVTGGARTRVIDAETQAVTDLGHTYAAIFGEYVAMISYDTAAVTRRNLDNGTVQTVRAAVPGCVSPCVDDDNWALAAWGHEVVYAFGHQGTVPDHVAGLWNGNTNATTAMPMLSDAEGALYTEVAYWSGLLLVARNNASVRLYDMRNAATESIVDTFAEEPFALDGNVVAWRPLSDLKAVVRDVRDFVPGHTPALRYLGGGVPTAFGTDAAPEWDARLLLSQNMTGGTLTIHSGSTSGPVVKSIPVSTLNGEISTTWDGTDGEDADVAQGTYYWTLESGGAAPAPVLRANGSSPVSGSIFVSRTALAAPSLTAPALSTDVTPSTTFPVSWTPPAGAPAGTRYRLERSINGGAFGLATTTGALSVAYGGSPGTTYRFRVAAVDPAGRIGAFSSVRTTVVPYQDNATGTVYTGSWATGSGGSFYGGSHRYSGTAGSTYTFKATGTTIWLVGTKSTNYGQFQVSIDGGAYSGLIDSYASSVQYRKVLYGVGRLSNTAHTIRVRVYGTSRRPYVGIDGVGFLR
ncbi:MAG TPA: fibronectin type III domain-containing protein [Frankiaceae bacterium]|jgi:hypothetical protein|nr:fibronectin type III domain-containing protein [Frankiaceae bacterium]